ncbi:efflux RND transporter periplasmic adaptor subunit [Neisseriaceae bacterium TC5R-5]|nr:efflux RND transporter periplasmic adaptor subunit [Neisseriaceae bacterium TC5R-5]
MMKQKNHGIGRYPYRLLLLTLVLALPACGKREAAQEVAPSQGVKLARLEPSALIGLRDFSGRVEPTSVSPLAAEVAGRVVAIPVLDGSTVKRGQLIARIDAEPYQLQLRRSNAQYQQLSLDLQRKRQLNAQGILPKAALEQLEASTTMARVQRDMAQRDMRNTELRAPFDGRLLSRNVELLQTVQVGVPIFNLEDNQRLDVSVDIAQNLVQQLHFNTALKAKAWLPDRPQQPLTLSYREHMALATAPGVSRVVFSGQRPDGLALSPGMSMRIRIEPTEDSAAQQAEWFAVPIGALSVTGDGSHRVWRFDSKAGKVQAVPVKVQEMQQEAALVTGKLVMGEKVVAAGAQFLRDGQTVHALEQN